jgi:hypothetical protein
MKATTALLAVYVMLLGTSIWAQAPQGPPKPAPELKRLTYYVGSWKIEGEAKPLAGMPGGKFSSIEKCEWYTGGFFIMCTSHGTSPMGPEKSIAFQGYDTNEKVYTYHEFSNMGDVISAKGTPDGDTWHWSAESKMGDTKMSIRVTIKEVSKTEYTFKLEVSQNGGEFSTIEEATGHKVTAAAPAKKS